MAGGAEAHAHGHTLDGDAGAVIDAVREASTGEHASVDTAVAATADEPSAASTAQAADAGEQPQQAPAGVASAADEVRETHDGSAQREEACDSSTPVRRGVSLSVSPGAEAASREGAATYIMREGLYLTGLEMYQELLERGVVVKDLRTFIEERTGEELELCNVEPWADREDALQRRIAVLQKENDKLARQVDELRRCRDISKKETLGQEIQVLHEKLRSQENRERDVLHAIAERLPTVITSVRSSRKDSLLQILLMMIEHHPEPRVRSSLLFHYVTLFKRPDEEQRRQVTEGFSALAVRLAKAEPLRVETELMGSIKGLEDCRYPEQKVLAVQLTLTVFPHLAAHIQDDLGRMFAYWMDDPAGMVREAALVGAAQLRLRGPFLSKGLGDASHRVQRAALRQAAPAYIAVARENDALPGVIDELLEGLPRAEATPARKAVFEYAITVLLEVVDETTPASIGARGDPLPGRLQKAVDRRLKGVWPAAEYLLESLPLGLLRIIATSVPPQQDHAVDILAAAVVLSGGKLNDVVAPVFYDIALHGPESMPPPRPAPHAHRVGGAGTVPRVSLPLASSPGGRKDAEGVDGPKPPPWSLLRAFVRYYLKAGVGGEHGAAPGERGAGPTANTAAGWVDDGAGGSGSLAGEDCGLCGLMMSTLSSHSDEPEVLEEFYTALCQLSEEFVDVGAVVVDVLWNCLVDQHRGVRRASVECISAFLHRGCLAPPIITKRVVPALVTFSTDDCDEVKVASVGCVAHLVTQPHDTPPDVIEKLGIALRAAFPAPGNPDTRAAYLATMVKYMARMGQGLLREHVYPILIDAASHAAHDTRDAPQSLVIPLLCECAKVLAHHPPADREALAPILAALRVLAKEVTEQYLKSTVAATVKELESAAKGDAEKKGRVLAKFRDILPNVDVATTSDKAAMHAKAGKDSPKRSVAEASASHIDDAPAQPLQPKFSILSKVQKKLFGAD